MIHYFKLFFFSCLFLFQIAKSQILLQPLTYGTSSAFLKNNTLRVAEQYDTLPLPFYEDFSSTYFFDSLWLSGSPVNINNRFSINHPSKGVATFDGLDSKGEPYDFSSTTTWGRADSLVSLAINLGYTNSDSVQLSFFCEAGGLGDNPDVNDSLCLYFLDSTSTWNRVWSRIGTDTPSVQNIFLFIGNSFLYKGFRFKFISYGNLFGQYDLWNLDNIYINKNRRISEMPPKDVSLIHETNPLLNGYYAVPYNHLLKNLDSSINNEVKFMLSNYYPRDTSVNFGIVWLNNTTGDTLLFDPLNSLTLDSLAKNIPVSAFIDTSALTLPDSLNELYLKSTVYLGNTDSFPNNDTISSVTLLSRSYAYDDNSAEWAFGLKQANAGFAVKFVTLETDTLSQIAVHFPKIWKDISNRNIEITVWKNMDTKNKGIKDSVLYSRLEKPGILKTLDSLTLFNLDSIIIIPDTFYIGFMVPADDFIFVGFDKNTDASKQSFTYLNNIWENLEYPGTLMIRPVFGKRVSTGIKEEIKTVSVSPCYPNPNSGILFCPEFLHDLQLWDIYGRIIMTLKYRRELLLPDDLPKGIYFLTGNSEHRVFHQKIVLQ